jgi:antitoxin component of RelBE/YafQ-DinJ toxin-antitoxin module
VDKVISARLDEAVVDQLDRVTRRLGMTKKQFLEEAIRLRASNADRDRTADVWDETCGAWRRREAATTTIRRAREAFQAAMLRHRRRPGRPAR